MHCKSQPWNRIASAGELGRTRTYVLCLLVLVVAVGLAILSSNPVPKYTRGRMRQEACLGPLRKDCGHSQMIMGSTQQDPKVCGPWSGSRLGPRIGILTLSPSPKTRGVAITFMNALANTPIRVTLTTSIRWGHPDRPIRSRTGQSAARYDLRLVQLFAALDREQPVQSVPTGRPLAAAPGQ